jgi:hypothetical protein
MRAKNIERARRVWSQIDNYPDGSDFRVLADLYTEERTREDVTMDSDAVGNVLTDLMHLCELAGIPFDEEMRVARNNYEAERDGADDE